MCGWALPFFVLAAILAPTMGDEAAAGQAAAVGADAGQACSAASGAPDPLAAKSFRPCRSAARP
jgi:hypothetical protein